MFDAKHGEELANEVYERILEREYVSLWYEDGFYDVEACWDRAADEVITMNDMYGEDMTDLMAYVLVEQDDCRGAWCDGFGYLFGSLLASRYEDENMEEE